MILLSDGNPLASLISFRFKPQRGKFTLAVLNIDKTGIGRFKPQRGKFTLRILLI